MSLRNFRTVMLGDFSAKALTAVFVLGLVRFLSSEQFAGYIFLSALMILAATLSSGFFNRHYIMAGDSAPPPQAYQRLQVASALAIFGVAALVLGREAGWFALAAGLACAAAAASFDFRRTHAQKCLRFGAYSMADVLRASLLVLLAVPVVHWGRDQTVGLLLVAQAAAFALAMRMLPPLPAGASRATVAAMRQVLASRSSLALLGYFALVGLFGQLPVLLFKPFADAQQLATFGSAFRYYGLLVGVVAAANVVILPRVALAGSGELRGTLRGVAGIVAVAGALVAAASVVGYFAIPLIDGGKYPDAPWLFVLLGLGLVPGLALAPTTAAFLRLDLHGDLLRSQVAAVAACAGAFYLLRQHGAWAAAISVPIGVMTQFVWLLAVSVRERTTL